MSTARYGGGGMSPSDVQKQDPDMASDQQDYTVDSSAAGTSRDSSYPIGVGMGPPPPPPSGPGGRPDTTDAETPPRRGASDGLVRPNVRNSIRHSLPEDPDANIHSNVMHTPKKGY